MSATLDDETRKSVIVKAGFREPVFINTSIDRPEIFIDIRTADNSRHEFEDLHFLFPDNITWEQAQTLEKTIIFFDSKQDVRLGLWACRKWLVGAGLTEQQASQVVGCYYAPMQMKEKERLRTHFRKADSAYRIMLATEAMGMGVEIEAIRCVVQYGSKTILNDISGFKSLVQRMGRCARGQDETGHFIWLVKPWFFAKAPQPYAVMPGFSSGLQNNITVDTETGTMKSSTAEATKWKNMDKTYQRLSQDCSRRVIFDFFTPKASKLWGLPRNQNQTCCWYCHPEKRLKSRASFTPQELQQAKKMLAEKEIRAYCQNRIEVLNLPHDYRLRSGPKQVWPATVMLNKWREKKAHEISKKSGISIEPCLFLSDASVTRLAEMNHILTEEHSELYIAHFVHTWPERERYKGEIRNMMIELCKNSAALSVARSPEDSRKQAKVNEEKGIKDQFEDRQRRRKARYGNLIPTSGLNGDMIEKNGRKLIEKEANKQRRPQRTLPTPIIAEPEAIPHFQLDIIAAGVNESGLSQTEAEGSDTTIESTQFFDTGSQDGQEMVGEGNDEANRLALVAFTNRSSPARDRWSTRLNHRSSPTREQRSTRMDHRSLAGDSRSYQAPTPSDSQPRRQEQKIRLQKQHLKRKKVQALESEISDDSSAQSDVSSRSGRQIRLTQKAIDAKLFRRR